MVLPVSGDVEMPGDRPQTKMQVGGELAHKLEAFVGSDIEDVVIKTPGQAVALVGAIQKELVELGIPTAQDGLIDTATVELSQDLDNGRAVAIVSREMRCICSPGAMFHVSRICQGLKGFSFTLAIRLKDAADFNDAMPVGIEPGCFQIDKN